LKLALAIALLFHPIEFFVYRTPQVHIVQKADMQAWANDRWWKRSAKII